MKTNLVSWLTPGAMPSMHIYAELENWHRTEGDGIELTSPCACYIEFASEIDAVIEKLQALKSQAKLKFDEFQRP